MTQYQIHKEEFEEWDDTYEYPETTILPTKYNTKKEALEQAVKLQQRDQVTPENEDEWTPDGPYYTVYPIKGLK